MKSALKLSFCFALLVNTSIYAQIVTDGSLGANASLSGSMIVPQSLGTTIGSNLFHSFQTFNINTGESATFTGNPSLTNVISRVTGGQVSNIDGLLQSTIGNANFYFINPAGVTFGANAQVDVPAAFYVSTANTLRFTDGNQFSASNPSASVLSIAAPSGFGFLNNQVGNISLQDSQLSFKQGSSVSLTANNVQLDNSSITSPEGSIQVVATGGVATEVPLNASTPDALGGQVALNNGSSLDTSGNSGGAIYIQSGNVSIDNNSVVHSDTSGTDNGGQVSVTANTLTVSNGSWISSDSSGTGNAGNVSINANNTTLNNGSISSDTYGVGNAGTVAITGNSLNVLGYTSAISSDTYGQGNGGNVIINAQQSTIDGGSIYSVARSASTGNAGSISVNGNSLDLNNKGWITTDTSSQGNAGNITINVAALNIVNDSYLSSGTFTSGNGGNITVNANSINIDNQAGTNLAGIIARAESDSLGKAGTIGISATGTVDVSNNGKISASTLSTGDAGTVFIKANALNVSSKGWINTDTRNSGTGNAGTVVIDSGDVTLDGGWISSDSYGAGKAGGISVTSNNLNVLNSGWISSDTYNKGDAGAITINSNNVAINGGYISSDTHGTGNAGDVTVNSNTLNVLNNGWVSSDTYNTGNAGNVSVNSNSLRVLNNGWISSNTYSSGNAGAISVNSGNVNLNGGWISSDTHSTGNAGSVFVKSNELNISNSGWISSDTYGTGNAGNIFVTADSLALSKSGRISSDNIDGNGGDINLNTGRLTLTEGGIISTTTNGLGNAGRINVQNADNIVIDGVDQQAIWTLNNGKQTTGQFSGFYLNTFGTGNGGNLLLNTNNLNMSNGGLISAIAAAPQNTANTTAGSLLINASNVNLSGGASISTTTSSVADAGSIIINAKNAMSISGQFNRQIYSSVTTPLGSDYSAILSNASRIFVPNATQLGSGGSIIINTPNLALSNGGLLSVSTEGDKVAGNINVNTALLTLDNARIAATAEQGSNGAAGSVRINASQAITEINNASINSSTFGNGKAGDVNIQTPYLSLDTGAEISALAGSGSSGETGVLNITANSVVLSNGGKISVQNDGIAANPSMIKPSDLILDIPNLALNGGVITAATSGNVNAGNVIVKTQNPLVLRSGASINSNTAGSGSAGNVSVNAPSIWLDNSTISAEASSQSQGQTGNVNVTAGQGVYLSNNANISMKNAANINNPTTIKPSAVTVSAPDIDLKNSSITTQSTGNVDAGNININFSHWLTLDPSFITTTANTGNGGNITITGGQLINLQNSGFLTSVSGANSNGGNIKVTADYLIMNTGVIQANAVGGSGGDIALNLNALIPSQNQLILGGKKVAWQPFQTGLNVIQAASENGVSGTVNVTSPQFDISASISGLDTEPLVMPNIDSNPCQSTAMMDSSLSRGGQGGIPSNEAQYGFIPPAVINAKPTSTPTTPLAHLSGTSFPCAK